MPKSNKGDDKGGSGGKMQTSGWSSVDDDLDEGDYKDLYAYLERSSGTRLSHPTEFVHGAVLDDDDKRALMDSWLYLNDFQLFAPINLRYGELRDVRRQLANLLDAHHVTALEDEDMDDWEEDAIMTPLPDEVYELTALDEDSKPLSDALPVNVVKYARRIISQVESLQEEIMVDIESGDFRDYTRLLEYFRNGDLETVYDAGRKATGMPYFGRRAIGYSDVTQQGTRMIHTEALAARVLSSMSAGDQIEQRRAQKKSSKRPNLRRRDDDNDDAE